MSEIFLFGLQIEIWALLFSIIAILLTLAKDFILPLWFKPELVFRYEEKPPYRRNNLSIGGQPNPNLKGTFLRFEVQNVGRRPALNCRCQILKVEKENKLCGDYKGFPLKWASRPEAVINPANGERLNIAIGETEFVDLAVALNNDPDIHFKKYHPIPIGIKESIGAGSYDLYLIFSGDNFDSYTLKFYINKENSNDPDKIELNLKTVVQKVARKIGS